MIQWVIISKWMSNVRWASICTCILYSDPLHVFSKTLVISLDFLHMWCLWNINCIYCIFYRFMLDFISLTLQKWSYHYLFYLDVCCSSNRHNFQFSVSTCNLLVVVANYTFSSSKESRDCGEVIQYTCKKKIILVWNWQYTPPDLKRTCLFSLW